MYTKRIIVLSIFIIFSFATDSAYSGKLHKGIISAVKSKARELKEKKDTIERAVTSPLDPNGGSISLPDGSSVSVPPNFLKASANITLRKYVSPLTSVGNAQILSPTYRLEIPLDDINDDLGDASKVSQTSIKLEIPVKQLVNTISKFQAVLDGSDPYEVIRININGIPTLYGNYTVSNNNVVIAIPYWYYKTSIGNLKGKVSIVTTDYEIISLKETLKKVSSQLFFVNKPFNVQDIQPPIYIHEMQLPITIGNKIPLIFIHGLLPDLNDGDSPEKKPHMGWENLVRYLFSNSNIFESNFVPFLLRYDTKDHIKTNASALKEFVDGYFNDIPKIVLVAHSMGGLVAHEYIRNMEGFEKVSKLITIATPFHGSPLASPKLWSTLSFFVPLLNFDGSKDVRWDYYTEQNPPTTDEGGNDYLLNLYIRTKSFPYSATAYVAFAGIMTTPSEMTHEKLYNVTFSLYNEPLLLSYRKETDGVVPVESAHYGGIPDDTLFQKRYLRNDDYDHSQLMVSKTSNDAIFQQIQNELLKVITTLTNNPPLISTINASPSTVVVNGTSTITCTASDPDGDTLTYSWSVTSGTISGSGSQIVWTAPSSSGTFTTTCSVSDGNGGIDKASWYLNVSPIESNSPPSVVISFPNYNLPENYKFNVNEIITFTQSSYDIESIITNYSWDFDGGAPATSTSPNSVAVNYPIPGPKYISLKVTDYKGVVSISKVGILIDDSSTNQAPLVIITSPESGKTYSRKITVDARKSIDDRTPFNNLLFTWYFDNVKDPEHSNVSGTAGAYFDKVFDTAGLHSIAVMIDDGE